MTMLIDLLEGFEDGQKVLISLKDNEKFVLYDFEMVDETIYNRSDLVIATISEVINSRFRYRNETILEFEIGDITELKDPISGDCYFKV
jgi:hypothetical protein